MKRRCNILVVAVLAALTPAVTACSTRGGTDPAPSLARNALPGLIGRRCEYASGHNTLPSFEDLVRVGTRGNIGFWGAEMESVDTAVVSVRYGEDGRLVWARTIGSSMQSDRVEPLERILMQSLHERGPADWGVRIRVAGGDIVGMAPSVVCPPEAGKGGPRTAVPMPVTRRDFEALSRARGRHYPVEIALDERGHVLQVRLERSSGEQIVDQFLVDWILATNFFPKLHDGIAMASTLTETLYLPRRP